MQVVAWHGSAPSMGLVPAVRPSGSTQRRTCHLACGEPLGFVTVCAIGPYCPLPYQTL